MVQDCLVKSVTLAQMLYIGFHTNIITHNNIVDITLFFLLWECISSVKSSTGRSTNEWHLWTNSWPNLLYKVLGYFQQNFFLPYFLDFGFYSDHLYHPHTLWLHSFCLCVDTLADDPMQLCVCVCERGENVITSPTQADGKGHMCTYIRIIAFRCFFFWGGGRSSCLRTMRGLFSISKLHLSLCFSPLLFSVLLSCFTSDEGNKTN